MEKSRWKEMKIAGIRRKEMMERRMDESEGKSNDISPHYPIDFNRRKTGFSTMEGTWRQG